MKLAIASTLCALVLGYATAADAQVLAQQTGSQQQVTPPSRTSGAARDEELRNQEVSERKQEGYEAQGIRLGSFYVMPELELREKFDDNIYATSVRRRDFYTTISPSVLVRSDFKVHEFEAFGGVDAIRYHRYLDESDELYLLYGRAKFDVWHDTWFSLRPSYERARERRSSPDAVNGIKPTRVYIRSLDFDSEYKPSRVWLRFDAGVTEREFENAVLGGGGVVNNHDRDRREDKMGLRAGYELVPGYYGFIEGRLNNRDYDQRVDDNGFNRNSKGYEVRAGASVDLTGKVKGDAFLGLMRQEYDDPRFETITAPTLGLGLRWNITTLTTIKTSIARTVEETTTGSSAGVLQDFAEISVDHELLRNLVLGAAVNVTRSEYRGLNREDTLIGGKLKAIYRMNRNILLGAEYEYNARDSNRDLGEYLANTFMVRVRLSY